MSERRAYILMAAVFLGVLALVVVTRTLVRLPTCTCKGDGCAVHNPCLDPQYYDGVRPSF